MPLYEDQRKRLMLQELKRRFGDNFTSNPEASETLKRIRTEPAFQQEFINEAEHGTMDSFMKYDALPLGLMVGGGLLTGLTGGAALPAIGLGISGIGALGAAGVGGARIAEAAERQQYGLPNTGALVGGEGFGQSGWGALELATAPLDIGIAAKQGINLARRGTSVVEDVLEKQLVGNTNYRKWKDPKLHLGPDGQPDPLLNILKEEDGSIILGRGQRSGDPISGQQTLSVMEVQPDGTLKAIRDADAFDEGMQSARQIDEGGRLVVGLPTVPPGARHDASGLLRALNKPTSPVRARAYHAGTSQSQEVIEAAKNLPPSGLDEAIQDIPEDEAFNQIRTIMDQVIDLDAGTILQHDMAVVSLVDDVFANLPEAAPVLQAHFRREAEAVDSLISSYRSIMEALPEFMPGKELWGAIPGSGLRRPAAAQDFARLVTPGQAATVGTAGGRVTKERKAINLLRRKRKAVVPGGEDIIETIGLSPAWGKAKEELKLFKELAEKFTGSATGIKDYRKVANAVDLLEAYGAEIQKVLELRKKAEDAILKATDIARQGGKGAIKAQKVAEKLAKQFKAASTRIRGFESGSKAKPGIQQVEEELQRSLQSTVEQQLDKFKTLASWWTKNIDVVRSQINTVIQTTADKDTGAIAEEVIKTLAVDPKMLRRKDLLEVVSELIDQQKGFTQKVGFERLFDGS